MKSSQFSFERNALESMVGGVSVMDIPHISVQSKDEARGFLAAYGYDIDIAEDLAKLWAYHRKAVTYIQSELLADGEFVPVKLSDPNELGDITNLLIIASTRGNDLQRWACGIIKVIHTFVHLENDLFNQYSSEIQDQILKPIESHIHTDSVIGTTLGPALGPQSIVLKKFDIKAFKTTSSSITKLLAKSELVAFSLLDKIGVRIVTKHLFDVFRVLKYFLENNIVSFPHNVPDQSGNTLYPLNLFFETIESVARNHNFSSDEMDKILLKRLNENLERAEYKEKYNSYSSQEFKFIKFITRRLVKIEIKSQDKPRQMTFFYPYEIQIVDYETHLKNNSGPASHELYKKRQLQKARTRVLGLNEFN